MKRETKPTGAVLKLNIRGKEYPCRVTMGAMIRFKRDTGVDVSRLDVSDLESMVRFVWHCVVSASKVDGIEFGMDFEEFADNLDPASLNGFYDGMATTEGEKKTKRQPT